MGGNPQGLDREPRRDLYWFIHNVYANFFKDSLDYLSLHLYPRFEHRVVGTYDKAVEYIIKTCQYEREVDKPMLPAIILNPSGDFELAEGIAGGKQLWRFPNLAPGMIKRIFDPVYQDRNVEVNVGFIRIQGDMEVLMLLNSFYEYCDLKMLLLQIFAGIDRWIYPQYFTTFIILPEELVNYKYKNPYTGFTYKLDWSSAGAYNKLVKTIASNELVIPCKIKPIYKLSGFNDASTRYGGVDQLADWRLGATIRYEIEIPSYLVLTSDYLVEQIDISINSGSAFSEYTSYSVPTFSKKIRVDYNWGLDATSHSIVDLDATCETTFLTDYIMSNRYFHIVTSVEASSPNDLLITLPEQILDKNGFLVNSKYGKMNYGDHYYVSDDGWTMTVRHDTVDLETGMVIELYVYKRIQ
ncbi:MAG: hypothetical protein ACTSPQ_12755 [Candidatus Helarchaeota archaeon]